MSIQKTIKNLIGEKKFAEIKKLVFETAKKEEFASKTLQDGTIINYEGDFAVGAALKMVTAEGENPIPDGSYQLEDGTVFVTVNGAIESIENPSEKKPAMEKMSDEEISSIVERVTKAIEGEFKAQTAEVSSLKKDKNILLSKIEKMEKVNKELFSIVEKIAESASATAIEEPLKFKSTENDTDKFASIARTLKAMREK